jgi:hypothetical protein
MSRAKSREQIIVIQDLSSRKCETNYGRLPKTKHLQIHEATSVNTYFCMVKETA